LRLAFAQVKALAFDVAPIFNRLYFRRPAIALGRPSDGDIERNVEINGGVPLRDQLRAMEKYPVEDQDRVGRDLFLRQVNRRIRSVIEDGAFDSA